MDIIKQLPRLRHNGWSEVETQVLVPFFEDGLEDCGVSEVWLGPRRRLDLVKDILFQSLADYLIFNVRLSDQNMGRSICYEFIFLRCDSRKIDQRKIRKKQWLCEQLPLLEEHARD